MNLIVKGFLHLSRISFSCPIVEKEYFGEKMYTDIKKLFLCSQFSWFLELYPAIHLLR